MKLLCLGYKGQSTLCCWSNNRLLTLDTSFHQRLLTDRITIPKDRRRFFY